MKQGSLIAKLILSLITFAYSIGGDSNSSYANITIASAHNLKPLLINLRQLNNLFSQNNESNSLSNLQEPRQVKEADETIVILPVSYNEQKSYPAVILLPFTDGTGLTFFNWGFRESYQKRTEDSYIVIIPPGAGKVDDYKTGDAFNETIQRYENLVKSNLENLIPKYNIDATRVGIAGYSLGADLAWALSLRNPNLFKGTILIDSFCSYRLPDSMNQLAERDFRVYMITGRKEDNEQNHPMNDLKLLLDQYKISNKYQEFPNAYHETIFRDIPSEMLMESVEYSLTP